MISRRSYLTTLVAAGFAGCAGNSSSSSTPSRPELTIEETAVQYSQFVRYNVDSHEVGGPDGQFVLVKINAHEVEPVINREAFSLVTSERHYDQITEDYASEVTPIQDFYGDEMGIVPRRGWIAFDVPAQLDRDPSLRVETDAGSWEWKLDIEKATAPPPNWEWTASGPEMVTFGEPIDITVTIENTGDGPGTFRGIVSHAVPRYSSEFITYELSPGKSGELLVTIGPPYASDFDPGDRIRYSIEGPVGSSSGSVVIESESKSTSTEKGN